MPVSFDQLRLFKSSPSARRALWHLLSVGSVWRDEIERHEGADKAGLHLFWVRRGLGWLETPLGRSRLAAGPCCWLVDLRLPRAYEPQGGIRLVTEGFRFNGPMLDTWLELLGGAGEFEISQCGLSRMKSLRSALSSIARTSPLKAEWRIHGLLTEAWGELLAVSSRLPGASSLASAPVQRVVDAVLARPDYPWQAGEMASLAGTSYSSLRAAFKAARGESVHSFLQQVRLDQARAWLADLRVPIKEVSARLHFRSETYFASWFRNLTGHPPGLHRRHLRG